MLSSSPSRLRAFGPAFLSSVRLEAARDGRGDSGRGTFKGGKSSARTFPQPLALLPASAAPGSSNRADKVTEDPPDGSKGVASFSPVCNAKVEKEPDMNDDVQNGNCQMEFLPIGRLFFKFYRPWSIWDRGTEADVHSRKWDEFGTETTKTGSGIIDGGVSIYISQHCHNSILLMNLQKIGDSIL
jgi:hypothetical protein